MTRFIYGRAINRAAQLLVLITLAGCGGGDSSGGGGGSGGGNSAPVTYWDCGGAGGIGLFFTWLAGGCTLVEVSGPDQVPDAPGILEPQTIEGWSSNYMEEVEPNNSTSEATPFVIQAAGSVRITGSVNDLTDQADFVAFTTQSFNLHAIYVCRTVTDCTNPFLQSNEIFIELLDQNGNIMRTTDMMQSSNGHEIAFTPSQGLHYFVVVRALNTGGVDFEYDLVITD